MAQKSGGTAGKRLPFPSRDFTTGLCYIGLRLHGVRSWTCTSGSKGVCGGPHGGLVQPRQERSQEDFGRTPTELPGLREHIKASAVELILERAEAGAIEHELARVLGLDRNRR
jgi:hypothetical protein